MARQGRKCSNAAPIQALVDGQLSKGCFLSGFFCYVCNEESPRRLGWKSYRKILRDPRRRMPTALQLQPRPWLSGLRLRIKCGFQGLPSFSRLKHPSKWHGHCEKDLLRHTNR
eukprot:4755702-Amphidinium_carterae.1